MKKYMISVIVAIYNVEEYVQKCIESIRKQTYSRLEIILVDDGSTDKSGMICDEQALQDNRINVIHKENGGLVSARKTGLKSANGDFIAFVDGDDFVDLKMYEYLLANLCETKADFAHTGFITGKNMDQEEAVTDNNVYELKKDGKVEILESLLEENNKFQFTPSIWSKLFVNDFIKKCYDIVPDNQSYGEDMVVLCKCVLEGHKISFVKGKLYYYNYRESSISKIKNINRISEESDLYKCLHDLFLEYKLYDILKINLELYFKRHIMNILYNLRDGKEIVLIRYKFPDIVKIQGKRIIIFGAGAVGKDYYFQLSCYSHIHILAWVDSFKENCKNDFMEISDKEILKDVDFDVIIIAAKNYCTAIEIEKELIELKIDKSKIIWKQPDCYF